VEANVSSSLALLTKHAVLLVGSLEFATKPGIHAMLDFHEMKVMLIGCEMQTI